LSKEITMLKIICQINVVFFIVLGLVFQGQSEISRPVLEIVEESWDRFRSIGTEIETARIIVESDKGSKEEKSLIRWMRFDANNDGVSIELKSPKRIKGTKLQILRDLKSSEIRLKLRRWSKDRPVADFPEKPFVNTDFTYKDTKELSGETITDYKYRIIGEDLKQWIVESLPKNLEEVVYEKRIIKISKETLAYLEIEYWNSGRVEKIQINKDFQFYGKAWRPNSVKIINKFLKRTTYFQVVKREANVKIPAWVFTKKFFQ